VQAFVSGLKLGPKTVHNVVAVLRSVWRTARAWGYVASDSFSGLVLPEIPKPEPRCFSIEEVLRVIAKAKEPHKTFYWLAAETGMRAGELCGLRWDDVDCERRLIRICQSAWNGTLQTPKTSSGRRVFAISRQLANQLRRQGRDRTGLVFVNRLDRPWQGGKVVEKNLRPLLDSLGIPRRGLHAFRHLNGSLMDRFNVPVKVRQERLGHSTAVMTLDHYTHAVSEDDRRIAARLGRVLCPLVPKRTGDRSAAASTAAGAQ
jgi:integrase